MKENPMTHLNKEALDLNWIKKYVVKFKFK